MAYDPNNPYQQQPQSPPPGGYQQPGYPPPGGQQPVVVGNPVAQLGPSSIGLDANLAGAISYFWVIGLIFFLVEKKNRFVRFHAFQSLLLGVSAWILTVALAFVPYVGFVGDLFGLVWFVGAVYAASQAYQGKWLKLPVIGDMAYRNALAWVPSDGAPLGQQPPPSPGQ